MRPTPIHKSEAFNRIELIVVSVVVFVLLSMCPALVRPHMEDVRNHCINNLKQIGTAYRVWANDHNDRFLASATNFGIDFGTKFT